MQMNGGMGKMISAFQSRADLVLVLSEQQLIEIYPNQERCRLSYYHRVAIHHDLLKTKELQYITMSGSLS